MLGAAKLAAIGMDQFSSPLLFLDSSPMLEKDSLSELD